jgi:hypothetical protein
MFDRECKLYAFTLDYCHKLADDIDDAQLATQPATGINHPAWILGHRRSRPTVRCGALGEPGVCPPEWQKLFGPARLPSRTARGTVEGRIARRDRCRAMRVMEGARRPTRNGWRDHKAPFEYLRTQLPTIEDAAGASHDDPCGDTPGTALDGGG